jgi:hypothetical protein
VFDVLSAFGFFLRLLSRQSFESRHHGQIRQTELVFAVFLIVKERMHGKRYQHDPR